MKEQIEKLINDYKEKVLETNSKKIYARKVKYKDLESLYIGEIKVYKTTIKDLQKILDLENQKPVSGGESEAISL